MLSSRTLAVFVFLKLLIFIEIEGSNDTQGKEFVVAFMESRQGDSEELEVFITTSKTSVIKVRVFCPTWGTLDNNATVTSGSYVKVQIGKEYKVSGTSVESKGIIITADDEITVSGINRQYHNSDGFIGIPTDVIGTDYYAVTYYPSSKETQLMVVGVHNATTVSIELPSGLNTQSVTLNGTAYNPGDTITMLLNRCDALQIQGNGDLSGAHITSDRVVSVFSGNRFTKLGSGTTKDHLVEQLTPVKTWGKIFAIVSTPRRTTGDSFRFVSSENNTSINCLCNANGNNVEYNISLLSAGDFTEQLIASESYCFVQADKPIMLVQFILSKVHSTRQTDPAMILIPPIEQYSANYTFVTPNCSEGSFQNYIMFVVKSDESYGIMIDDIALSNSTILYDIPNSNYVGGSFNISEGYHTVWSKFQFSVFGVILYGAELYESYGFPAGMKLSEINKPCVKTETIFGDRLDNDCDGLIDEESCTAENKGIDNDGDGISDEDCAQPAPIDGGWTVWNTWGDCVEGCPSTGSNILLRKFRKRFCNNPEPQYGGAQCSGNSTDSVTCAIPAAMSESLTMQKWRSFIHLIDLKFTSNIVWSEVVQNLGVCAQECNEDDSCLSYTFSNSDSICQGYDKMYLNPKEVASQAQDNTRYFITNDDYTIQQSTKIFYKFYTCLKYMDAEVVCQKDKAELLIIDNTNKLLEMWTAIESSTSYVPDTSPYVSGTLINSNMWTFWNNQSIPTDIWSNGHSTEVVNKCAVITKNGLSSSNCEELRHFICQR